jgi:hypothetical protein
MGVLCHLGMMGVSQQAILAFTLERGFKYGGH